MRKWFSALAVIAALCGASAALADDPASVYSDFAGDGVLNCGHSRSALNGVLKDASLYQYGDPLTMLQLKLVIRRQLAGGCRGPVRASVFPPSTGAGSAGSPAVGSRTRTSAKSKASREARKPGHSSGAPEVQPAAIGGTEDDGPMALLAVGLLLLTLATAGWAARRALTDQG